MDTGNTLSELSGQTSKQPYTCSEAKDELHKYDSHCQTKITPLWHGYASHDSCIDELETEVRAASD